MNVKKALILIQNILALSYRKFSLNRAGRYDDIERLSMNVSSNPCTTLQPTNDNGKSLLLNSRVFKARWVVTLREFALWSIFTLFYRLKYRTLYVVHNICYWGARSNSCTHQI